MCIKMPPGNDTVISVNSIINFIEKDIILLNMVNKAGFETLVRVLSMPLHTYLNQTYICIVFTLSQHQNWCLIINWQSFVMNTITR